MAGWTCTSARGIPDFGTLIPKRMFRNAEGRAFQDVTTAGNFGHLQKGHAIAFGDVDNDGDQDVFEEMGGAFLADKAYSALYLNPGGATTGCGLELEGVRSNRSAIGARIKVELKTERNTLISTGRSAAVEASDALPCARRSASRTQRASPRSRCSGRQRDRSNDSSGCCVIADTASGRTLRQRSRSSGEAESKPGHDGMEQRD